LPVDGNSPDENPEEINLKSLQLDERGLIRARGQERLSLLNLREIRSRRDLERARSADQRPDLIGFPDQPIPYLRYLGRVPRSSLASSSCDIKP